MDNREIDIKAEGRKSFDLAFQLFFEGHSKATHYFEHPEKGLVFLWHEDSFNLNKVGALPADKCTKANKLPYSMDWKAAADLAWGWLLEQPKEKYLDALDHDGSNGKGFRVYNESWTHVAGSHYGICAVQPIWAWYGK